MTMQMRALLGAALVAWVGLAAGCEPKPTGKAVAVGQTTPVPILAQFAGSDGGFATAQAMIIQSADQLDALGSQDAVDLEVDYDAQSLVLVTLGEMPTDGYGVTNFPVAHGMGPFITYPYAGAVIAKTDAGRVQVEPTP